MPPIHIAILASGSGSNAENIFNYFSGRNDIEISLILSNKAEAYVHKRAERLCIPSLTMSKQDLEDSNKILRVFRNYRINFVILAGYLMLVPKELILAYPNRIVNIHPALLPRFGGKGMYGDKVHQAVVESGDSESGITIHYVNENFDDGAIIFQIKCAVSKNDTPENVASKVHALEYKYYPSIVDKIIKKEFQLSLD